MDQPGAMFIGERRYKEALADIDKALSLGLHEPAKAYYNRAIAYEGLDDETQAYLDYQQALVLNPGWELPQHELLRFTVTRRDALSAGTTRRSRRRPGARRHCANDGGGAAARTAASSIDTPSPGRGGASMPSVRAKTRDWSVGQQVGALVVVDAERHLLQDMVGGAGGDLQAGRQRHRAERAVRRHGDVIGFGHGRDAPDLGDAAGMGQVGLDDVRQAAARGSA